MKVVGLKNFKLDNVENFPELTVPKCLEDYKVQIEVGALGECVFATANYHDFLVDFW